MPNVQQKKFNRGGLVALGFVVAMVLIMLLNLDLWIKATIDVVLLLLFIYIRRGYIFFYRAVVHFKKGRSQKVWPLMEKALKAGVDPERKTMVGSAYIQQGDPARGVEVLESVMSDQKAGDFRNTATITCSMGYWILGQHERAIKVLEDLNDTGYRNDSLNINLETYLLESGDLKKAKALIAEGRKNNTENNGLLDNRGWYYILTGNWAKAKEVYDELIDDRNAKFPEAYLHGAQVSIHDGDVSQAIDRLGWGISKRFSSTCMTDKDYIEHLLMGLQNPATREAFAKAMDAASTEVANSRKFDGYELATAFDEDSDGAIKPQEKPKFDPMAEARKAQNPNNDEENSDICPDGDINTDVDDDDREPNTDLDESDEEFAVEYAGDFSDDDFSDVDESSPVTDLDDDDDREPNTDLDEDE